MTREQAKSITFKKCLIRPVHLCGLPYDPYLSHDPATGITTRDMTHLVAQDFELMEFSITSVPIVGRVKKLKTRYESPDS